MKTLLLEIGTEEIPAGYISPALTALADKLTTRLDQERIKHGKAKTLGTPRRLAVMVDKVADRQTTLTETLMGPPVTVAFDKKGRPLVPAVKFAEKAGVTVKQLKIRKTAKGSWLYAEKRARGQAATTLLKTILPDVILATPFPKTMKWGSQHILFARPIRTIVALLGKKVIPFKIETIKAGRATQGHYFMAPKKIQIESPAMYVSQLRKAKVVAAIETRQKAVKKSIDAAAQKAGGYILEDPALLAEVTNLVEFPAPVVGRFDAEFLKLPSEILITAMREHQRYFALVNKKGALLPAFVAVNNTQTRDMDLVAEGHGKVIRARLSDAAFFYGNDTSVPMDQWVDQLKGVTFQADLGTMYEKTLRIQKLTAWLAKATNQGKRVTGWSKRGATLCKTDLVSEMVGEFPKLQGVMGRIYAGVAKEPKAVATAIEEHYRPVASGAALPKSATGALISIADKIDSLCGFFSIGLTPTGGADPYALRRQSIGVIQILNSRNLDISLEALLKAGLKHYKVGGGKKKAVLVAGMIRFLKRRIERLLTDEGYSKDLVSAVTAVSIDSIPGVWRRAEALARLRTAPDFDDLAAAFKRVANIIKKAGTQKGAKVNARLLKEPTEKKLYKAVQSAQKEIIKQLKSGNYNSALKTIAGVKAPVDQFFDDVMVMVNEAELRNNRLALLGQVAGLFGEVADFTLINA